MQRSLRYAIVSIVFTTTILNANRADAALYASTAAGAAGRLYILDPATGVMVQDIGPLDGTNGVNYPITGLAFHPTSGALYGSTGNNPAATAGMLVKIDPATAVVTVIGAFNTGVSNSSGVPATMADIAFDSAGNLYGVASIGGPQLYSVNPATGQATLIGSTGLTSTTGGGLAISSDNTFYGTPTATRFGTYNPATGAFSNLANPAKPVGGAYGGLDFNGSVLYGLNVGSGSPPPTHLVTITTAGVVTDLGVSVNSLDAIAFSPEAPVSPALSVAKSASEVVVSWPNVSGFRLESKNDLNSGAWSTNTPTPVLNNGTNSVSVAPSGTAAFYRLQKP